MARVRDGKRAKGRRQAWSTTVHSRPNRENARPRTKQCQVPCALQQQGGSCGPSEKMATAVKECEVELLEGRRIITNELETKGRVRENIGDENRRRKGERDTFTKAPSIGLVKETIPARTDKIDVRAQRKGGREDNTQVPVLLDQRQGNAAKMYTAVRAAAQRTKDHSGGLGGADTKIETPANAPSMHGVESQLKVSL